MRRGGSDAARIADRRRVPAACNASMSPMSMLARDPRMTRSRSAARMKSLYASAVVANPSGIRIPSGVKVLRISPSDAFLPPTVATSAMPMSSNHRIQVIGVFMRVHSEPQRPGEKRQPLGRCPRPNRHGPFRSRKQPTAQGPTDVEFCRRQWPRQPCRCLTAFPLSK
jgi:hypothetical protein